MAKRLYIGPKDGVKVIRLSKAGFDAETGDVEDMILASDRSQFQIALLATVTLSTVTTTVQLPTDCTGCNLYVLDFITTRSPAGPSESIKFTTAISGDELVITITEATVSGSPYMPPNFVNFTRTVQVLIVKE